MNREVELLVQSEIRNMSIECARIGGINLSQGISKFPIAEPIQERVGCAVAEGKNHYTRYDGIFPLREAIADKYREQGIVCDPEKNVIVSAGATGAFYCACMALLNPGDEVIIFEPYYGYHINTLWAVHAVPVYVRLFPPEWSFTLEQLERVVTEKTKAIMINTPANPSGKVFSKNELTALGYFCKKHRLWVFTDEIYEYFLYDDNQHIIPASLPEFSGKTITISGYSKTFSTTGWRVGYAVVPGKLHDIIGYINDLIYVCAPSPLQYGIAEGMKSLPDDFYVTLAEKFQEKRDRIWSTLTEIGLEPYIPQGAYYILAKADKIPGTNSKAKALTLLRETKVASVPGRAFYHGNGGDNLLRFCFAQEDDVLDQACNALLRLK
jgi:aminotransferase